jgi:hypothetical protein
MSLQRLLGTEWTPQPLLVYKPRNKGDGVAMRVQLRLEPEWEEIEASEGKPQGFARPVIKGNGGLFLELAEQQGTGEGGFAKFGWTDDRLIRVKLGIADVSKILTGIQQVRVAGQELPASMRGKDGDPFVLALFHKFGDQSTAISMKFEGDRSFIRVSKSKDWSRSISLELHEELQLKAYLELALEGFLRVGLR